ncbi:sugar ABC transporter permease [Thalassospira lucentensis]|uniref:Carbohydrate ABC transporter membrane protein 1, CUT1 family n=3 Tax=Thalassospiraceae TaxID=2844866 RepID=A0A154KW69_9PROT|nr:sugar ABC transporter permease [Thalassospira xiamenensis]KZB62407.1 sugar ABC transporter permease [Thalassospira lucentensis]KZB55682.1 sugar ABC transporter permease [Thalassospira xiamenensis]RCK46855.1 sugar ABC transporter permease [Thalassospira xiamenensis]SIT15514.1 carbohydrate ABC transporter membrane protein 1, CUT1 family [Thalassospira xiamenensis M-5 = DSM 17429]SOB94679.1 carbohydrate ABC transporter membrane protein 1, CUT1 family [Thalassospira xiamenensis]
MRLKSRNRTVTALLLIAPFVICYLVVFAYPVYKMFAMSFTDAPLIGEGEWIGFDNYIRMFEHKLFYTSVYNTLYFVLLTVVPNTLIGLGIAMMVVRLKGWIQAGILVLFFMPYILPVTVVTQIWQWILDQQFGVVQPLIEAVVGRRISVFRDPVWAMPMVALVTIWWTNGFNVLLFISALRNIPDDYYEAASLDGASRLQQFRRITWPLLWPVTALVLTLQLILQLKIFDQIYLMTQGGPFNSTYVLLQLVYREAFGRNQGGYASAVAVALFVIIVAVSVLQYQLLKARGK